MDKKIVFLDMDETTLNSDKSLSKENFDAIHAALDAGHYIVISSGRPICNCKGLIDLLQLDHPNGYVIGFNGGVCYDISNKSTLFQISLSKEHAKFLAKEAQKAGLYIQTYDDTSILTTKDCDELQFYNRFIHMPFHVQEDLWDTLDHDVPKLLMVHKTDHEKMALFQESVKEWAIGKCNHFFSCKEYLEFTPAKASKGLALVELANRLNIPISDTIAIGDEENDRSMIEMAGLGVCMCNGNNSLKDVADYITEHDNNHGGVAEVIYKFVLNQ